MRLPIGIFAALLLLTPAASASEAARTPSAATDANTAAEQFHAALRMGDGETAATLLADALVVYEEGEAELSKAQYASSHLQADIAFLATMTETIVARNGGSSGDLAWIVTQGRTNGLYHGRAVDRETTETMVLQRFADGWKIVHIHWSSKAAR